MCSRGTKGRPTGPSPSSTTTTCTRRTFRWDPARRRRPDERRHARMVDHSGRPDPVHTSTARSPSWRQGTPRSGAVPKHVPMETVGDHRRCLRSEHREGAEDVSDGREAGAVAGFSSSRRVPGKGTYAEGKSRSSISMQWSPDGQTRRFVSRRSRVANIILGQGIQPPALTEQGHFHPESAEFWFTAGKRSATTSKGCRSSMADQGDIVYVPKQRCHLASFAGDPCRAASR